MDRLINTIAGRIVAILLHGNSVQELEQRIEEFKDLSLCYCAINHFRIMEEKILCKINKNLSLIYCSNNKELNLRQKNIEEFLDRNDNNMFMTTINPMIAKESFVNKYHNKIHFAEQIMYAGGIYPNSLMVFLYTLIKVGVKRIILFGCDGLDIEDTDNIQAITSTYFGKEQLMKENRDWNLIADTRNFNNNFAGVLREKYEKPIINFLDIVNCSLNSHIITFKKIPYQNVIKWIKREYDQRIFPMSPVDYHIKELYRIIPSFGNKSIEEFEKEMLKIHEKYDKIVTWNTVESIINKYRKHPIHPK